MGRKNRNPASCTRGVRGNDPLGKSIIRDNTRPPAVPHPFPSWNSHDEATLAHRRVVAVGSIDPMWFDKLLEGNNPSGKLILIQQRCPETPAWVTFCGESSGFSIADNISFGLALQIGLEALRRGAEVQIEIGD